MSMKFENDAKYLEIILNPIRVCADYKPKMGKGKRSGMSLDEFQKLYRSDPFYLWFGLDNPLMYAAHKAAGGMTSVYRQIGIGCEHLFRAILQDSLGLTEEESRWSYSITGTNNKIRSLSLDGRILYEGIRGIAKKKKFKKWLSAASRELDINKNIAESLMGAVFEVRQGYKSKDSKRQNADIANAATAYTQGYFPCVILMSAQIDSDILTRYRNEKWMVLIGALSGGNPLNSTYAFLREIIEYDLAVFFERHAEIIRKEVEVVLESLLRA